MKKSILFAVMAAALLSCASSDEPKQPEQESNFWDDVKRDRLNSFVIDMVSDVKNPQDVGTYELMQLAAKRTNEYFKLNEGKEIGLPKGLAFHLDKRQEYSPYAYFTASSENGLKDYSVNLTFLCKWDRETWRAMTSDKRSLYYISGPLLEGSCSTDYALGYNYFNMAIVTDFPTFTPID